MPFGIGGPVFVSVPHVSWWMMHLDTRGSGDDDDQVPGVIDITLRGSGESIESPGRGDL